MNTHASDTSDQSGSHERTSSLDLVAHQPWCDPAEHTLTASAFEDERGNAIDTGCVGGVIEVDGAVQDLGGWWHRDRQGQPEFIIDRGFDTALSAGAVRLVEELLNTPEGTEQLRRLAHGAVSALGGAAV